MSEQQIKITLAQLNPTVGDVAGNAAKARLARDKAKADGADLVVLSELFIAGYPPEDLVLKPAFQSACRAAIEELARETADGGPAMLIGIQRERRAVEDQLVLAANLVQIDQRQPALGDPRHHDGQPEIGLVAGIGRAVRHHQDFGAGLGETFDDVLVFL